jgi:molybdopterin converting factor small subunit
MLDFETKISGIDYKIRQLIESKKALEDKLSESERRNKELENQIYNNNLIIKKLEEQNKILNLGNTLSDKGNSTEIKIKINRLIREIDKSIELLTKVEK